MPIQLYVSNALPRLATQLASDLRQHNPGVFEQQYIVTQTEGMNNWLKIKIAEELGITANCIFKKPNDIVSQIYYWLGGYDKPVLNSDFIKWNIFHLLNDPEFIKKFPAISTYYSNHDVKRIALSTKVADLFDQYQIYRPEIIAAWKKKELQEVSDWQEYLWLRMNLKTGNAMLDKTDTMQLIIQFLKNEDKRHILKTKLPHLHFFGIAVITPFYLRLFYELSKYISISFYLLNPAPTSYWLEDKSEKEIARIIQKSRNHPLAGKYSTTGNELLNSWGNIIKDSFSLLFEDETYINNYNDELAQEPGTPNTLLQKIQHDIYFNAPAESRNKIEEEDLNDGSVTINACYTLVREVEVLYNYLVHLVDREKDKFSPRNIVVMVSNIDNYAPYISAVFDNAPYYFPYTIADECIGTGNSMFSAIEMILSLQLDSFKAEEVLELLESKYIRHRFGIENSDLIRKNIEAANIRFGQKGEKENDTRMLSWQYGLKRIMYGICISGEPVLNIDGDTLIPLDTVEGADSHELIRFWYLMQILEETIQERRLDRSIANWGVYLQELVEKMVFQSGEKDDEDFHRLISYLEKLTLLEEVSSEHISFEVFRHSFLEILNTETQALSFAGAGITFCSLIPMRSIPFKVVAMMGMDFDKFPRKEAKLSFNLLENKKRKGDRNVKENDKHLFLETIQSAQKYFYLSYIGRSAKDASKIPPSSLVDELVEYIIQGTEDAGEELKNRLITTHPLHGFSQKYFNGSGLYSYLSDEKYQSTDSMPAIVKEEAEFIFDEILLKDLLTFFKDPIKWYFNKGLGIYYKEDTVLLPDNEVFELDNLSLWKLKKDLLTIHETEYEEYFRTQHLKGIFPLKNIGRIVFDEILEEIGPMAAKLNDIKGNAPAVTMEINLQIGNSTITGILNTIYGTRMLCYSDSKSYNKYVIEAYINYLIALAQGLKIDLYYIEFKSGEVYKILNGTITQAQATEHLEILTGYYKSGFSRAFLFSPALGMQPFETDAKNFVSEINKRYSNNFDFTFKDPYMLKAYENNFFAEENFEMMKKNTRILEQIGSLMPGII